MNKKIQLLAVAFVLSASSFAQIGIGTTSPDASSALDIMATDKGFLMPRMTSVQRTAIASPAMGLQVFDTDTKSVWTNNGAAWTEGVGAAGKFIEGAATDIAYYENRVGIGRNSFSESHQFYVESKKSSNRNVAVKIDAINEGTAAALTLYGIGVEANNKSTGTLDYSIGVRPLVTNIQGGTIKNAVGLWPEVDNKGTVNYAAGVIGRITNTGTISSTEGVTADITNNGTITYATGMYIGYSGTGTATNSYGIYITPGFNKGVNENYAVYSDSDADSYFKGNFGAGIVAPKRKAHISGAMRLEPQAMAPANGSLGDLYVNTDGKLYFYNGTAWKEVQLVP